ncbi:MAG: TetR/AcrR family transcriptional regulator [Polyangiaceae bacterium]|nr:TetR/AcrR family transcriptional regulator [Polyangiaceae bacterium]
MATREARKSAKSRQITEAAQRLFLDHGVAATSMDAIATTAGVSKRTLYAHYPSKEQLLQSVLEGLIAKTLDRLALVDEHASDLPSLRRALVAVAEQVLVTLLDRDYIGLARVVIAEAARLPELGATFRRTIPERVIAGVADLLRHAKNRGLVSFSDDEAAARLLMGPILTYVLMDGLLGQDPARPPRRERIEAIVDLFILAIEKPQSTGLSKRRRQKGDNQ